MQSLLHVKKGCFDRNSPCPLMGWSGRDCARQQARPDRLGGSQQGTRLRVRQDGGDGVPTCLILAPCSGLSRRSLAAVEQDVRTTRRPALTALARGASARAGRDEGTTARHEQRNSAK